MVAGIAVLVLNYFIKLNTRYNIIVNLSYLFVVFQINIDTLLISQLVFYVFLLTNMEQIPPDDEDTPEVRGSFAALVARTRRSNNFSNPRKP